MRRLLLLLILVSVPSAQAAPVETFVSPDSSFPAVSGFLDKAESSLFLASYTFSSPEITQMLLQKQRDGVEVRLIVEKSPAGGMSDYQVAALCALYADNVTVLLYDGPLRYMHAKYVIRDGRDVLVTSENFGYSGFMPDGDYGNRGWGAIVEGEAADELLMIYKEDSADSVPFECGPGRYVLDSWNPAGAYSPVFESETFRGQQVGLICSPDSLDELLEVIGSAGESIDVEEFYIYTHWGSPSRDSVESAPSPVLDALIKKAREGVRVRILLDSTYYEMDPENSVSNYNTMEYVNSIASNESIPIEARAADLDGHGIAMLHNKGVVIDGKKVLVSSINWNENSIMNNREIGLIIEGEAAAYYQAAFDYDWGEKPEEYGFGFWPAMLSLAALIIVVLYFSRRKINFRVE
jgi:cardiolipin synthase